MMSYKGYKEMTKCVLEARDEHNRKVKIRQAKIKRYTPTALGLGFAAVLGFGFWGHMNKTPKIESILPMIEAPTEENSIMESTTSSTHTSVQSTDNSFTHQTTEQESKPMESSSKENVSGDYHTEPEKTTEHLQNSDSSSDANTFPKNTSETGTIATQQIETPTESLTTIDEDKSCDCDVDNHVYLHWNEMMINQQYFMADFRESQLSYSTAEKEVPVSDVAEYIGEAFMSGYDWYEYIYYHCEADAYKIKGDDEANTIAIKFIDDEKYYLYTLNVPNNADSLDGQLSG